MREVTFTGRQDALRLRGSGRVLVRGDRTEVTDAEADRLAGREDVTVHQQPPSDDD